MNRVTHSGTAPLFVATLVLRNLTSAFPDPVRQQIYIVRHSGGTARQLSDVSVRRARRRGTAYSRRDLQQLSLRIGAPRALDRFRIGGHIHLRRADGWMQHRNSRHERAVTGRDATTSESTIRHSGGRSFHVTNARV